MRSRDRSADDTLGVEQATAWTAVVHALLVAKSSPSAIEEVAQITLMTLPNPTYRSNHTDQSLPFARSNYGIRWWSLRPRGQTTARSSPAPFPKRMQSQLAGEATQGSGLIFFADPAQGPRGEGCQRKGRRRG